MYTTNNIEQYGTTVFGSKDKYITWPETLCPALGLIHKELLGTEAGRELIQEELVRIEHGIFA